MNDSLPSRRGKVSSGSAVEDSWWVKGFPSFGPSGVPLLSLEGPEVGVFGTTTGPVLGN